MALTLENIWVWYWLGSRILPLIVSWHGAGSIFWISTLIFRKSLVLLSLVLTIGYPLEYTNPGSELSDTLLGAPLGLRFLSEAVRCMCCCRQLMNCHEGTCWGVCIYCVPPSGDLIISNMNSVRYFQLLELITLSLSPTWLIPYSARSWRAA